jgi:hypothetical protein
MPICNDILAGGSIPKKWQLAEIVQIYSGKGKHADPEMYRPISLLNTADKLFARLLQSRLVTVSDHKLSGRPVEKHIYPSLIASNVKEEEEAEDAETKKAGSVDKDGWQRSFSKGSS